MLCWVVRVRFIAVGAGTADFVVRRFTYGKGLLPCWRSSTSASRLTCLGMSGSTSTVTVTVTTARVALWLGVMGVLVVPLAIVDRRVVSVSMIVTIVVGPSSKGPKLVVSVGRALGG